MRRGALRELGLWVLLIVSAIAFSLCVVPGHGKLLPKAPPDPGRLECTEWRHHYGSRVGVDRPYITYTVCDRYEWRVEKLTK